MRTPYTCLDCSYTWPKRLHNTMRPRCPNCRSCRVVPTTFPLMVERAKKLGINRDTPVRDVLRVFRAVRSEESIMDLGWDEFRRVMGLVLKSVEKEES